MYNLSSLSATSSASLSATFNAPSFASLCLGGFLDAQFLGEPLPVTSSGPANASFYSSFCTFYVIPRVKTLLCLQAQHTLPPQIHLSLASRESTNM